MSIGEVELIILEKPPSQVAFLIPYLAQPQRLPLPVASSNMGCAHVGSYDTVLPTQEIGRLSIRTAPACSGTCLPSVF